MCARSGPTVKLNTQAAMEADETGKPGVCTPGIFQQATITVSVEVRSGGQRADQNMVRQQYVQNLD